RLLRAACAAGPLPQRPRAIRGRVRRRGSRGRPPRRPRSPSRGRSAGRPPRRHPTAVVPRRPVVLDGRLGAPLRRRHPGPPGAVMGPWLIVVTGWTGAGKSTMADLLATEIGATVASFDWLMSALRSHDDVWPL